MEQAEAANIAVAEHAGVRGSYVTAMLGRLDLRTGVCALLNAGHVPPLLVRDDDARLLDLPRNFPLACSPRPATTPGRPGQVLLRMIKRLTPPLS